MTGFLIVPTWLAAMSWLVAHDIVPTWTALDPPPIRASQRDRNGVDHSEFTIYDEVGRVGSLWTSYLFDDRSVRREDLVWIDRLPVDLAPLRVTANSDFTAEGVLDEFTLRLETEQADVKLHGERFPADFSFRLESGAVDRTFKVPLSQGGIISGAFNPMTEMRELSVGTRWRMQVLNPFALLTGVGSQFIPVVVEVTGEERIATPRGERNCMVVESPSAKAWVDSDGLVQVQEVTLPLGGSFRIVRQDGFDDAARSAARQVPLGPKRSKRR